MNQPQAKVSPGAQAFLEKIRAHLSDEFILTARRMRIPQANVFVLSHPQTPISSHYAIADEVLFSTRDKDSFARHAAKTLLDNWVRARFWREQGGDEGESPKADETDS